jgi:Lon protease-like protein
VSPSGPIPIFPLPGAFLFPHQVMALHVFEPRYRTMIADLLDGPGRLVVGTLRRGEVETPTHAPAFLPVAGLGEIMRHERLPDGRFHIWVVGLGRVNLEEQPSPHPYRLVRCTPFIEIAAPEAEASELAERLRAATSARLDQPLPLPPSTPPGLLADLLVQTLGAPQPVLERVFAEPSVSTRARLALAAAADRPPPHHG